MHVFLTGSQGFPSNIDVEMNFCRINRNKKTVDSEPLDYSSWWLHSAMQRVRGVNNGNGAVK